MTNPTYDKPIPKYGTDEWRLYQYIIASQARRGHNYEYWNETKHKAMLKNGWELYKFSKELFTESELEAKELVETLRSTGHYARVIAGYHQTIQHEKYFSIIYKLKQK